MGYAETTVNFGDLDSIFKVTTAKFVFDLANFCVRNNLRMIRWISLTFYTNVCIWNVQTAVVFGDIDTIFKLITYKIARYFIFIHYPRNVST